MSQYTQHYTHFNEFYCIYGCIKSTNIYCSGKTTPKRKEIDEVNISTSITPIFQQKFSINAIVKHRQY